MAETTFAATQTAPGREARCLEVDRESLASGMVGEPVDGRPSRTCVSSGAPISHCEIRIVDEAGSDLPAGHVGEIAIRSDTMFDGYRNAPEETSKVLRDGWYYSGDLGFLDDGECFVIGRKKDLIIVAGKNLYPEDVEDVVGKVPGVIPGRVVAFGVEDASAGTERIAVVAETLLVDQAQREALGLEIRRAGMAIDVTISDVHLAPPRWLIKSSSGKPSRRSNRERILEGHLDTGRSAK
jgi:acyl-CoA synthetase (AMP-forming)/AMP-acid ligase II